MIVVPNFLEPDHFKRMVRCATEVEYSIGLPKVVKCNWTVHLFPDFETAVYMAKEEDQFVSTKYAEHPLPGLSSQVYSCLQDIASSRIDSFGRKAHIEFQYTDPGAVWKPHVHKDHKLVATIPISPPKLSSKDLGGTIFYDKDPAGEAVDWRLNQAVIFTDELHSFENMTDRRRFTVNIFC